jgi:hypothetical protein
MGWFTITFWDDLKTLQHNTFTCFEMMWCLGWFSDILLYLSLKTYYIHLSTTLSITHIPKPHLIISTHVSFFTNYTYYNVSSRDSPYPTFCDDLKMGWFTITFWDDLKTLQHNTFTCFEMMWWLGWVSDTFLFFLSFSYYTHIRNTLLRFYVSSTYISYVYLLIHIYLFISLEKNNLY